jgi:hypothetical protein
MAKIKLSSNDHESDKEVPEGDLPALVASADDAAVADPKMPVLKVQFTITDGDFKTKAVYRSFRLRSKQDHEALNGLCDVVGVALDKNDGFDTNDLIGRELIVVVRLVSRSWKDKAGKLVTRKFPDVVSFKRLDGAKASEGEDGRDGAQDERQAKHAGTSKGARRRSTKVGGADENA